MEIFIQIIVTLITTSLGSLLSYFAAIKKSKDEVKALEIKAENEIKKMKIDTEEQIKLKIAESDLASKENDEKLKNEAVSIVINELIKNPKEMINKFKDIQEFSNIFKNN